MVCKLWGIVAGVAMLGACVPARAADAPQGGATRPAVLPTTAEGAPYQDLLARPPLSDEQVETDRVDRMARRMQNAEGGNHAGEDALGTGTALTH
jgi:hypothetical protein